MALEGAFHAPDCRAFGYSEENTKPRGATAGGATFGWQAKVRRPADPKPEDKLIARDIGAKVRKQSTLREARQRRLEVSKGDPWSGAMCGEPGEAPAAKTRKQRPTDEGAQQRPGPRACAKPDYEG